jgi:DNA polymerase-1
LDDGYEHPAFLGLPHLPLVRTYVLPEEGHVILKRDFSGQELHVFGHFEHGELQQKYIEDPDLDVHDFVGAKAISIMGREIKRGRVKILNFQGMYGGGIPAAQAAMRVSYAEAKAFKDFHDKALPGRKILSDQLSAIVRMGMAVRTYGGRLYTRPPFMKRADGSMSPADYRMLNYLIQGSSADITKRAMLNLVGDSRYNSFFMLQVYDEMNISAPIDQAAEQMEVLRHAMESIPLRTSLPTDGEWGWNWGEMHKVKSEDDLLRMAA